MEGKKKKNQPNFQLPRPTKVPLETLAGSGQLYSPNLVCVDLLCRHMPHHLAMSHSAR